MTQIDIVILKPGSQKKLYGELSAIGASAIEPPLWGALLAGFLREKGYAVELLDAEVEEWSHTEAARRVSELNPRLLAVSVSGSNPSASTMNMHGAGEILREHATLAPASKRLIMGLHPSALPEQTIREEPVDFLCQGEGFYTLPALLDALKSDAPPSEIPGLWRKEGGAVIPGDYPPVWERLGELPRPAWEMLPMNKYRAHNWHCFSDIENRSPYGVIYTSLGCPFGCEFCCINSLFGGRHRIRYRPPEAVVTEIDYMVERYAIKNFKIIDEMFAMNEDHVIRLCEMLAQRRYRLNFWAYARVNTVHPRLLAAMKSAGINWVAYGFEAASEKVLSDAEKGFKPEQALQSARLTREAGQYLCANFIFGLPEDDMESMRETLALAEEINGEWCNLYSAMAYPGSRLYETAMQKGWQLPGSWSGYSQYSADCLPLPTRHLSAGQVLAFRDYAFHKYHQSSRYLDRLTATFGKPVADYVRELTKTELFRKNSVPFGGAA